MSEVQAPDALVGAWRLVSWENRAADGQVTYPMGSDALGCLLYTVDGHFSVTISRRGRAGFAAGDLLSASAEEQARAVMGFVAYAGRYSFHGDSVIHHVELSLFPNWVGTDQERWVELAGDQLTLSASPLLLAGKQQVPRLLWERVNPSLGATDCYLRGLTQPADQGSPTLMGHHRANSPQPTARCVAGDRCRTGRSRRI